MLRLLKEENPVSAHVLLPQETTFSELIFFLSLGALEKDKTFAMPILSMLAPARPRLTFQPSF